MRSSMRRTDGRIAGGGRHDASSTSDGDDDGESLVLPLARHLITRPIFTSAPGHPFTVTPRRRFITCVFN